MVSDRKSLTNSTGSIEKGGKEVVSEKDREYSRKFSSTIGKLLIIKCYLFCLFLYN